MTTTLTPTTRLLRIPHYRDNDNVILVKVSANSNSLDLNLLATENVAPYSSTVVHTHLRRLRASSYTGSDEEWQAILRWLLLHETPTTTCSIPLDQVELVVHSIELEKEINVIVRQNIKGITHRLGIIQLVYDDSIEFLLFDWNILALTERDTAEASVASMKQDHVRQQHDVADLRKQLRQLTEAKKNHEDELLEKFRLLLNSKKAKIRDQKRLLSTVKVDRATAEHVSTSRGGTGKKKVDRKGKGKRRLDDDDDEEMQAQDSEDLETEPEDVRSPEHQSDTEATTDEEDSTVPASQPPAPQPSKTTKSTSKPPANVANDDSSDSGFEDAAPMSQRMRSNGGASQNAAHGARKQPPSPPKPDKSPPVRPLPFRHAAATKENPVASKSAQPAPIDDDETDDEL